MQRIAFVLLAAVGAFIAPTASVAGPPTVGDIALIDQTGTAFHLRELLGRPLAITFVATRCQDTCPMTNAIFAQFSRNARGARLLTVSIDPAYDTPFVVANYARGLGARPPVWRFATGRPRDVARVLAAFGVVLQRGPDGIPDVHSDFIYILDRGGKLRNTLPLSSNTVADLRIALDRQAR